MLDILLRFDTWLILIGASLLIRQLNMIISAEQGRKSDLVKKRYQSNYENHISILIPYVEGAQYPNLYQLVTALENQDYPRSKVSINIAAPESIYLDLEGLPTEGNVRLWKYPADKAPEEKVQAWLIDRCLAQGGSGLITFLKPNNIVKSDFLQSIAVKGFDNLIIQGYVALKTYPDNPIDKVIALSKRLFNRVENAGRFHMGLSCRLQETGWAVKKEVLEMIPYKKGWDIDNLEYTIRLNLQGFRVVWAPSVVVYAQEPDSQISWVTSHVASFFNKVRLLLMYGPRLIVQSLMKMHFGYFIS